MTTQGGTQQRSHYRVPILPIFVLGLLALATVTQGGVEVQLALDPDQEAYSPNQVVQVEVKLAQAPGGADQLLRLVEFDLQATDPLLTLALPLMHNRGTARTGDDINFWSFSSLADCVTSPTFCGFGHFLDDDRSAGPVDPRENVLSIAFYNLTASSHAQILLPASGAPVTIGRLQVTMPAFDGDFMLNLINSGDLGTGRGARVDFGFDPHIIWEARNAAPNDVTGGTVLFHVVSPLAASSTLMVPEPDVQATRMLSFKVPAAGDGNGSPTAIRITMVDLHDPQPPNAPCCPAPNFSAYEAPNCMAAGERNGCSRWVGRPATYRESQDNQDLGVFRAARLQCTPYYHNFAAEALIHVSGAEIVPSSKYDVQIFGASCKGHEAGCSAVSAVAQMTTRRSGDVVAPFNPPATSTQPDGSDVVQVVNKFKNERGALSKTFAKIQSNDLDLNADVSGSDVVQFVDAFKQLAYPFSGPCPCPSTVICGGVECPSGPAPCVAAFGAGATCVRTCEGGGNAGNPCIDNIHCPGGICGDAFCRDHCGRCDVLDCHDGNPCTDEYFSNGTCWYGYNSNSCDDHSACTTNDHCVSGSCSGTMIDCNDNNMCTDDVCNPWSGCVHSNNANSCDDGFFCNGIDTCMDGSCSVHPGNPCQQNAFCDELSDHCTSGNPVVSLKAVKRNGAPVPAANQSSLSVLGGDTIEAEIFLSGWANAFPPPYRGVRDYQVALAGKESATSGDNGTILPQGWCAPLDQVPCQQSAACPSDYPICNNPPGCTCAGHDPECCAFIDRSRADFLFANLTGFYLIDVGSLNYRYAGIPENLANILDSGVPRYLGSVVLKVSPIACGTFTMDFQTGVKRPNTFIENIYGIKVLPNSSPLVLWVPINDCSRQLRSCSPGHCFEDARISHDRLNPAAKFNTNTIEMTFSKSTVGMSSSDFEVTVFPFVSSDPVPGIDSVTPVAGNPNKSTVVFNRRIQQTRWTCIRDKGSNKRCCAGSLPGDADYNRYSLPGDIFDLLNNLISGCPDPPDCWEPHLPMERCDTDRNTQCSPADVLMLNDLINGADAFVEVNGDSLPPLAPSCPDMRLPPPPPSP